MAKKLRVLAFCDSPACFSGFGQVARNILMQMHNSGKYDVECFGINHQYEHDEYGRMGQSPYPFPIMKSNYITVDEKKKGFDPTDPFGRAKFLKLISQEKYDIIWSVQDPYVVDFIGDAMQRYEKELHKERPQVVFYFPVDAHDTYPEWLRIPLLLDFPVVYTEFGKKEIIRSARESIEEGVVNGKQLLNKALEIPVIYHGTNTTDFYPTDHTDKDKKEYKKEVFGDENAYLVMNLNRNQPRKDMPRTILAFKEFRKQVPEAVLWLFCKDRDIGWNLRDLVYRFDLVVNKDVFFAEYPEGEKAQKGIPIEVINEAYNMADMVITTTLGEGWGLSVTEAMATRTPVIAPRNTSMPEIIGDDERGFLCECGTTLSELFVMPGAEREPIRQLTNVESLVEKMMLVYENKDKPLVQDKVEAAFKWVKERTWSKIFEEQWMPLLDKVAEKCNKS